MFHNPVIDHAALFREQLNDFLVSLIAAPAHDFPRNVQRIQLVAHRQLQLGVYRTIVITAEVNRRAFFDNHNLGPGFSRGYSRTQTAHTGADNHDISFLRFLDGAVSNGFRCLHKRRFSPGSQAAFLILAHIGGTAFATPGHNPGRHHPGHGKHAGFQEITTGHAVIFFVSHFYPPFTNCKISLAIIVNRKLRSPLV